MYYPAKEDLKSFADEVVDTMLSYNVSRTEAYLYLTNQIDLMDGSYELHCCVFDLDPIQYIRECDLRMKWRNEL